MHIVWWRRRSKAERRSSFRTTATPIRRRRVPSRGFDLHATTARVLSRAIRRGGAVYSMSGADALVESGAALVVQNNTATRIRSGVYLQSEGSTFRPPATARASLSRAIRQEKEEAVCSHRLCRRWSKAAALAAWNNTAMKGAGGGVPSKRVRPSRPPATARASLSRAIQQEKQEAVCSSSGADVLVGGRSCSANRHKPASGQNSSEEVRPSRPPATARASLSRAIRQEKRRRYSSSVARVGRKRSGARVQNNTATSMSEAACTF